MKLLYYFSVCSILLFVACKDSPKKEIAQSGDNINKNVTVADSNNQVPDTDVPLIDDQKDYMIKQVLENDGIIWGMDWLPNNELLYTTKQGQVFRFDGKKNYEIKNIPEVYIRGQGGLMDITVHPNYKEQPFIYLSYASTSGQGSGGNTTIARAKLINDELTDLNVLYKAVPNTKAGQHFGSRFTWDKEGHLYFSVGDRGNRDENPQDITRDGGKIYRIMDDGSIPKDNPFVNESGAKTAIYSYGHRNPQGLTTHPISGKVMDHEHGPRGGDEINTIVKGLNYGWPVISYGINYDGSTFTNLTQKEGMQQPNWYWKPSIAPSGFAIINNQDYGDWNGGYLAGSLKFQYLELLYNVDGKVTKREKIADGIGRVRDVSIGPDNYIYISVESKGIYRITPN
ncbi:hypothetical protein AAT17_12365 [Nonlabens sp. MIC269]|uniref:PQQ-dependent sugar dehydrogenase n=1 Tax=Nonlabens sp. MIC269 TaxID=1476901 RepID=UPI0007226B6F|nr:PQQ-dependent sugar dehydrogenase [Nonlabens sp. MIC269]ALM21969.1 hypothetical protein AAT17_12365 [Nonlabens sp. MIC269]